LLENERLEQALDRGREENDRLLAEKNESISQLSHQLRVLELHPEASPRQDSSLLRTLRQYLEDILNHFDSEQSARNKNINLLDQISRLQSELNQVRLKDQEAKMELIEEYEHKLRELRLEREASDRQYATAISQRLDELNSTQESVRQETERKNKLISEMESRLRRLEEDKQLRFEEFQEREQQLEDQYSVLSQHTKAIEALRAQMDDKDMAFALLRTDHEAEKDDNDILIHTIGFLLEYINRRRNAVPISHIHNEDNKAKLLALLSRFNVPTVTS
jgi:chromosome segregation ATPase